MGIIQDDFKKGYNELQESLKQKKDIWEIPEEDTTTLIENDEWQQNPQNPYKDNPPKPKPNNTKTQPNTTNEENFTARYLLKARLKKEATETLVEQIKKKYVIYTTRDDDKSECWIYEEGVFKPNAHSYIKEFTRQNIGEWFTSQIVNEVISKIEADTFIEQDDFFSRQNKHPNLIPVINGVLNIDTKQLFSHNPDYCFFNKLPIKYDPSVDCPHIKKFLQEVLPTQESLLTLQEFYGSCLLKEYRYEKSLMLTGTGSNGKGKTLELLKYLLGIENCAEISLQAIEQDQFAMGELVNKMANISGDISSEALKNTGSFKNLTGRDLIMAARKFKTRVKFINYAKMIFSANEIPNTQDMTDGFFRRWIVIDFPFKFLDEKDRIDMTNVSPNLIKKKDPEIINKITTEEEMCGFLNWCITGYDRLKEQTDFSNNQTINKVRVIWIRKANSVQAFILDCVEEDYDSMITKADFKMWYVAYCRRHNLKQMTDKMINNTLTNNYNVFEVRPFNNGEDRDRSWKGIKFVNFGVEKQ